MYVYPPRSRSRAKRDPVIQACLRMLDDADAHEAFIRRAAELMGWRFAGGVREARKRCNQYWNEQPARHLPAKLVSVAIEVTGLDYVTPILQRVAMRAEDRIAAECQEIEERRPMLVRRGEERRREAG